MPRLFVAVDLPIAAIAELVRIQPPPVSGLRLVEPANMHLTLHFIGEAEIEPIKSALQTIAVPAFSLTLDSVGQFPSTGGGAIAWAGVRRTPQLLSLHTVVGEVLARLGFQRESRPYAPHITLVRCKQKAAPEVAAFTERHSAFLLSDQPIATFGLYASTIVDDVPVYHCEQSFSLDG